MEDLEFWEGHLEISRQPCGGGGGIEYREE